MTNRQSKLLCFYFQLCWFLFNGANVPQIPRCFKFPSSWGGWGCLRIDKIHKCREIRTNYDTSREYFVRDPKGSPQDRTKDFSRRRGIFKTNSGREGYKKNVENGLKICFYLFLLRSQNLDKHFGGRGPNTLTLPWIQPWATLRVPVADYSDIYFVKRIFLENNTNLRIKLLVNLTWINLAWYKSRIKCQILVMTVILPDEFESLCIPETFYGSSFEIHALQSLEQIFSLVLYLNRH